RVRGVLARIASRSRGRRGAPGRRRPGAGARPAATRGPREPPAPVPRHRPSSPSVSRAAPRYLRSISGRSCCRTGAGQVREVVATENVNQSSTDAAEPSTPDLPQAGGIKRKNLILIGIVTALVWAFAIQTG